MKHGLRRSRKKYYESRHCLSNGWGSPLVTYPRVRIRSGQRKRGELLYAVAGHALRLRRPSLLVSDDREIVSEGLDSFRSILLCGPGTCPPFVKPCSTLLATLQQANDSWLWYEQLLQNRPRFPRQGCKTITSKDSNTS